MNEIIIKKSELDYIIRKTDVMIVYLKSGKRWVCKLQYVPSDETDEFITLELATKGKGD